MKKLLFFLTIFFSISSYSQNDDSYFFRFHYLDIKGDVNAFIKDNKEYFKILAGEAVKENKWAGWSMLRSLRHPSKFIFVHHFSNAKQVENTNNNFGNIFDGSKAKGLKLTPPDWSKYEISSSSPYEIWERNAAITDDEPSNYYIISHFKFTNKTKFIENNRLWGNTVVKPQLKSKKGYSWGCATILSYTKWDNNQMISFNGMSWDGYDSLETILTEFSYNKGDTPSYETKYFRDFQKQANDNDLINAFSAKESEIYQHLDSTWK